ncbi:MAG: MarR family transcriptional regulator [Planctomycetes bacterium]|nr:MarR family transcriptional regulator [Planctomycetota bacterium]
MKSAERIDLLFKSVLTRFFSIPARQPSSGAVTFAQMRVLWILDSRGPEALSVLARRLGVSNSTATELVDRLVRGGSVRREHSPRDRRQVVLSLRPRGKRLLDEFSRRRRERFERLLRVVDRSDVRRMAEALETLNEIVGKWEEGGDA